MAGPRLNRRRTLSLLGAMALCGGLAGPAPAVAQLQAYGVAARVNGEPITAERLERSFEEYLREQQINIGALRSPQRAKTLKREALDLLIDQELLWQQARREQLVAGDVEVAGVLADMRSRHGDAAAFAARLATEGYTEAAYVEHLRRLLSARKLLARLGEGVSVDDAQVSAFYRQNAERIGQPEAAVRERIVAHLRQEQFRADREALVRRLRADARIEVLVPLPVADPSADEPSFSPAQRARTVPQSPG
jgi:SurA N-terminal domain